MTTNYYVNSILLDDLAVRADLFTQGGLWLWGSNDSGQLGNNDDSATNKSSPVQTISSGVNWKQVSMNGSITACIKTDGTLWLWGDNLLNELGGVSGFMFSSPVQTVAGGTNWKQVSCGFYTPAAVKTDGSLWLWGDNSSGQIGTNNVTGYASPVQTISGGRTWKQVAAGSSYTSAVKTDGTLWSWGVNSNGNLGDNSTTSKSSPVQTVSGGTNWKLVNIGDSHTAAIKTDGTLWLWGINTSGVLGDNSIVKKSSPVQTVAGGTNWKQVACGVAFSVAIKTDGTLWGWGLGTSGQLGTNGVASTSSPVQTVSGGTNWKLVAASSSATAAIKTDGTLWAWGNAGQGQLGNNSLAAKSSPVQTIAGGSNWKTLSSYGGIATTFAGIRTDFY